MSRPARTRVVFYQRKPFRNTSYSIEQMFANVRARLPDDMEPVLAVSSLANAGIWRRLFNLFQAPFRQGDINHVTGDIQYVTFLLRKARTVLTVHDCAFEETLTGWRRVVFRWLWLRIPVSRVALVATDSNFSRQRILLHTGCEDDKVHVVPACVSDRFVRIDKPFNRDRPTILQVGTLPNKNLGRVCAALDGIACHLHVLGVLEPGQERMLESSGLDWSNSFGLSEAEVVEAYGRCDLVVFASTYEGFGLPIIEANAVGRAVVTSDVASMPETAGAAACLVDPWDVGSIRAGIVRVIQDDRYREALVSRGYDNSRRFSSTVTTDAYVAIYRQLLAAGRRSDRLSSAGGG